MLILLMLDPDMSQVLQTETCPLCGFLSPSLTLHVSHLRLVHARDENFLVSCGISGCPELYHSFPAFSSHVYRHHREELGLENFPENTEEQQSPEGPTQSISDQDSQRAEDDDQEMEVDRGIASKSSKIERKKTVATFLMGLSEGEQLSQSAVSSVIVGCRNLCDQALFLARDRVVAKLSENNVESSIVDCVLEGFSDATFDLFTGIDTTYLREKFYAEHMNYLVSCFKIINRILK